MSIFARYQTRYEALQEEEMSIQEYLDVCKSDKTAYASVAERMLIAIGEPELVDTRLDPRLSRIFANKMMKLYPAFREFYGMEEVIEHIVSYFRHAAQGLEEKKQILYLLGPVGGGKSSLAERLKYLMEKVPFYCIKGSPVHESPLGLFNVDEDGPILEEDYGIAKRYLGTIMSPWAVKRLHEFNGDITRFRVVKLRPSVLRQVAVLRAAGGELLMGSADAPAVVHADGSTGPAPEGAFVAPMLLGFADTTAPAVHEVEAFGPVASVLGYGSVAEAAELVAAVLASLPAHQVEQPQQGP